MTSPRFVGDDVLDACRDGTGVMSQSQNRDGLAVARVQHSLAELGFNLGLAGADGIFGSNTALAVHEFKKRQGIVPNDGAVGVKTSKALDDAFALTTP